MTSPLTVSATVKSTIFFPTDTAKSLLKKNLEPTQACFPRPPIAPVSPGASLCPSGNETGAAVT